MPMISNHEELCTKNTGDPNSVININWGILMRKKDKADSTSLLSKNIFIEGDLSGNENFKIEGKIKGSVDVAGDIIIAESASVEAEIKGNNVVVKGSVKGNITSRNLIEIHATGKVTGDIMAKSVDIQEGATFEGRSQMLQAGKILENTPPTSEVRESTPREDKSGKSQK